MKLQPMRFKDYVWPHNPRVYEISYKKELVAHKVPFGLYTLQAMGRNHRILRGEGEFSGEGAYSQFKKLATVFYSNEPGVLVHPLWDTTMALFASLELKQEPTENYVKYAFEFWECYEGYESGLKKIVHAAESTKEEIVHTVQTGESIWDIAGQYNVSAEDIVKANPDIKNVAKLPGGGLIRVAIK